MVDGEDLWSAHLLLPPLRHLHGMSYSSQAAQVCEDVRVSQNKVLRSEKGERGFFSEILSGLA